MFDPSQVMNSSEIMNSSEVMNTSEQPVRCVILTITYSGQVDQKVVDTIDWLKSNLAEQGMVLCGNATIQDDQNTIIQAIRQATKLAPSADLMLICGEQSFAKNDLWLKITDELLEKKIPGFAERLRLLAFDKNVPSDAMYIQATAGKYRKMIVFAMPLELSVVKLAFQSLITPSIEPHVFELRSK